MRWNNHYELEGKHAPFSPSKSSTLLKKNKKDLQNYIINTYATDIGTALHNIARVFIEERVKIRPVYKPVIFVIIRLMYPYIPRYAIDMDKYFDNMMLYVNDAIGFRMDPEVVLKYSENIFGTADAISFNEKTKFLRIHDLKTGTSPVHIEQLLVYAALFCMEYDVKPSEINIELRIYQNGEYCQYIPEIDELAPLIDLLRYDNKVLTDMRKEEN